jgi:hypothetical protein
LRLGGIESGTEWFPEQEVSWGESFDDRDGEAAVRTEAWGFDGEGRGGVPSVAHR